MQIIVTVETPGGLKVRHVAEIDGERDLPDAMVAAVDKFHAEYEGIPLAEHSTIRIERV